MLYYLNYIKHDPDIRGKNKKIDNTVYTFDIETTSFLILNNKILKTTEYLKLSKEDREACEYRACMYIWMLGINEQVYYGRTWDELKEFLSMIDKNVPERKIIFIHNLSFEFQFLKSIFHFKEVTARKAHKVITALMRDYNILLRCSYMMSNCALKYLPELFKLPVEKMTGDLDYSLLRHSKTKLTDKEYKYCENDCLVLYHYILYELATYDRVDKIPTTSTGHVRRELKELVLKDFNYKRIVRASINTNPIVYNRLQSCFMGGYTHANWIFASDIIESVDSYDETSAYPYVLTTCKYPSKEFRKGNIKRREDMLKHFAYILVVKFTNLECKYNNTFISSSKCKNIRGAVYDNGRIIRASELEMTLTDIDFNFILDTYNCEYEILESWWSLYNYLPKQFINFILDKYVIKTKYKNVEGKELEYQKEKGKFNALYGMSVTNTIRDDVIYSDKTGEWFEEELTNDDIVDKLEGEKKQAFLSFSYGVWCTAWARDNLLRRVIALDDYVLYCDTDSIKLRPGYDKNIFTLYNKKVEEKIRYVSKLLKIPFEKYCPEDVYGKKHLLGVFESEGTYDKFITQGAKKYAIEKDNKIQITVAGVPKTGAKALKRLEDFKDNFVFSFEDTGKNLLIYVDNQSKIKLTDYQNNEYLVEDLSGCALVPTTYVLSKALDYASLLSDNSSKRAVYKE